MPRRIRLLRRGTALTRAEKKEFGPVQIIVVGFHDLSFQGRIFPELRRLRDLEIVRLVDMVVVTKSDAGDLVGVKVSDLDQKESTQFGAIAGALVGLGPEGDIGAQVRAGDEVDTLGYLGDERTWSVADAIPPGTMAVVALLEHRWAIPLRDAVQTAGGTTLADAWVHPDDLAFYRGVAAAKEAEAGGKS
jgi:hypothetical protein